MYSAGTEVLNLQDPMRPEVVARYRPDDALAYGVDYHRGRLYVNDINRGVEVLSIRGVR
jgi:hypothetical protein